MGSRLAKGSDAVRKRIENHTFDHEEGDEYGASAFGGFTDYFRRKKIKLQNLDAELRSQSTDKPQIFRGIVANVNGYTQPSLNDLHKLIVQYGGGFMQYMDGKTTVTHIIASTLTPKKAVEFKKYRIVKPAWIVESIKAGKLLPWDQFRVLDEGAGQRVIGFNDGKVVNEVSNQSRGYKEQSDTSWYTKQLQATPRSSGRAAFRTQHATTDAADETDEINDLPPSTQRITTDFIDAIDEIDELPTSTQPPTSTAVGMVDSDQELVSSRSSPLVPEDVAEQCIQQVEANDSESESNVVAWPIKDNSRLLTDRDKTMLQFFADIGGQNAEQSDEGLIAGEDTGAREQDSEPPRKRTKLTAEEHNEILLADPRIRKSSVVNPDFLEQYYRESRLHHLSTWKADLKAQLQAMADEKSASQKTKHKSAAGARRYIMHVDFDSFFAAVSLKKHPQYKDKPVVIAHGSGNGSEIASCNYPARKFGISNGMWMKRAMDLYPDLKVLPYDFLAYEEASRAFYEAIIATDGLVQSVSVDEALVDISHLCFLAVGSDGVKRHEGTVYREQGEADKIAQRMRDEVKSKTDCDVSVGIGGNILLAKVALRKAKPAGQHQIRPEEVLDLIGQLEVTSLPGVAYSIGGKLEEMGIKFVKDIREFTKERMINSLGPKTGQKLWDSARGIDRKEVGDVEIRKSVSAEVNWGVRFYNQEQVDEFIESLCSELMKRLVKEGVKGKQLSLKIMRRAADAPLDPPKHLGHGKCDTFNRSVILGVATNAFEVLTKESLSMLKAFGFSPGELRGIGVQMTRLEPLRAAKSSQRRLQFIAGDVKKPAETLAGDNDPIEDVVTPRKPRTTDKAIFGAVELNKNSPSKKPLNTLGTQFILPSQVDPSVLAELPKDIRDKLSRHMPGLKTLTEKTMSHPRGTPKVFTALPAESQIDSNILESLPEDVRQEIADFYNMDKSPSRRKYAGDQAVLPQSPRKNRTVVPSKRSVTLRKRGRPGKFDVRSNTSNVTLTQSNFIAPHMARHRSPDFATTDTEAEDSDKPRQGEDMDPEFLAALPEDIRREVLEEQRRRRLEKTSHLHVATNRKKPALAHQAPIDRLLKLPPRPPKPTFTGRKLSSLSDLRVAISEWAHEFKEEGPYKEDTDALAMYMAKVVLEECNMGKAVAAVRWLTWIVEEELSEPQDARASWADALEKVKKSVQQAVQQKGIGKLSL